MVESLSYYSHSVEITYHMIPKWSLGKPVDQCTSISQLTTKFPSPLTG